MSGTAKPEAARFKTAEQEQRFERVALKHKLREWENAAMLQPCGDCVEIATHDACRAINRRNREIEKSLAHKQSYQLLPIERLANTRRA